MVRLGSDCSGLSSDFVSLKLAFGQSIRVSTAFISAACLHCGTPFCQNCCWAGTLSQGHRPRQEENGLADARAFWRYASSSSHLDLDESFCVFCLLKSNSKFEIQEKVYDDITLRDNSSAPACDLYVSGAPCPAFSSAGRQQSLGDVRGCVLIHSLDYVVEKRPRLAVFENVRGLSGPKCKAVLDAVVKILRLCNYSVRAQVLDTKVHGGIPHSRPRLYLVAVSKAWAVKEEMRRVFPDPITCPSLSRFIINNVQQKRDVTDLALKNIKAAKAFAEAKGWDVKRQIVCDGGATEMFRCVMLECSPCLTKSRASSNGHFLVTLNRWMNIWEMAALQGWPKVPVDEVLQSFPARQMGATIGDGMSLSILQRMLPRATLASQLISKLPHDIWADSAKVKGHLPDAVYGLVSPGHEQGALWR